MSTFVYGYDGGQARFNTSAPVGVWGDSGSSYGVIGSTHSGVGVYAVCDFDPLFPGYALVADGHILLRGFVEAGPLNCEGLWVKGAANINTVDGGLNVKGRLTKAQGQFKIDHPLDPANQYLCHSFVESPDMKNIYDGLVMLDEKGEAEVKLAEWFEPLNRDFRYQLTAIGAPGPNLYIAEEIKGNLFKIAGGQPGMKVSWQVTGIRHDAYAQAHPIMVEEEKTLAEKGSFLHPEEQRKAA